MQNFLQADDGQTDLVLTSGGALACSYIFHVILNNWDTRHEGKVSVARVKLVLWANVSKKTFSNYVYVLLPVLFLYLSMYESGI